MTLTSATTISSSEAGCCGGGACCPGACCMTTTDNSGSLTKGPAGRLAGPPSLGRHRCAKPAPDRKRSVCIAKSFRRRAFPFRLSA
jgi:hypothetical protein